MKRRDFAKVAVTGAAGLSLSPTILTGTGWKGANDRVNIAVIGIKSQGQLHVTGYSALKNARVTALCDVDSNLFDERVKKLFTDKGIQKPKLYTDLRKVYEDKDIDAVSIATPNHWHALASIWALQAGKHVSVEKPCCHNFFEGRKLVEAAEKYRLIVQDGAEQRSNPCAQTMADYLHSGKLGEVYMAKGLCYKWRDTIGRTPEEPVPAGVDYDLWLGPAPKQPFTKNRFHYNWHWNWDFGNGDMGNQGVHEMDIARWGLNVTLPTKISATGGHLMFEDDQQTPNVLMAVLEFSNPDGGGDKKKILQFEVRHWITNREGIKSESSPGGNTYMVSAENTVGNLFYGSKGFLTKNVNEWETFMGKERIAGDSGSGLGDHYSAFVEAIRANDQKIAKGDIKEGFYSCALVHLANIAFRLGRILDFDPVKMKFINAPDADALLTREYRKPFVVPEVV